jgi:hypothetical protein
VRGGGGTKSLLDIQSVSQTRQSRTKILWTQNKQDLDKTEQSETWGSQDGEDFNVLLGSHSGWTRRLITNISEIYTVNIFTPEDGDSMFL